MKLNTMLVPLDGSSLAESALSRALDLAGPDTTLVLLHAVEAPPFRGADALTADRHVVDEAEAYLAVQRERLLAAGAKKVEVSLWYGGSASAIVEAARACKADLIVMTTHGRSGLGRFILGSVTEAVLRGTTVPILVLRDSAAPLAAPPATEVEPRRA
ncbi:MAG TPA: universal stress protein [Methylomirabilota bacterium]|jgi:nucleotide-binding universal stress UspA family protein